MSNFRKRQIQRENIDADVRLENGGQTLVADYANGDADISELEKQVEGEVTILAEGEVLEQDTETVEQFEDKLEDEEVEVSEAEAETISIATEGIANRWGITPSRKLKRENFGRDRKDNRTMAREAITDTLKDMWETFVEWIKSLWDGAREIWKKYVNAGKSLVKQSETNSKIIDGLGDKKKETIKGGFIKQLSEGKVFIGDDVAKMNAIGTKSTDIRLLETIGGEAEKAAAAEVTDAKAKETVDAAVDAAVGEADKATKELQPILGGENVEIKAKGGEAGASISFTFKPVDKGDLADDVPTPDTSKLAEVNDYMGDFGKELEKFVNKFRTVESSRKKVLDGLEKSKKAASKGAESAEEKAAARAIKRGITVLVTTMGNVEKVAHKSRTNLAKGLSGYVRAGIAAYGKE